MARRATTPAASFRGRPENEARAFDIAQRQCGYYHKFAVATSITRGPGNFISYKCVWDPPGAVVRRRERDVIVK